MRQFAPAVLRLAALGAGAFSSAAATDYYTGAHTFCTAGSGCDAVRHSALGQSIGQALPAIGMAGYAAVLLLSLASSAQARLLGHVAALTGGVAGAVLLVLQAVNVGAFCSLCIGVDVAAIVCALAALAAMGDPGERRDGPPVPPPFHAVARAGLAVALGAPIAWALSMPATVPAYVASLGRAGKINVIEFSDFECPYCRGLHPHLKRALESHGERIHFVRKSFPLPGHRHARHATRAYLCADGEGRGEAMADALFSAEHPDAATAARVARELGLDGDAYARCVTDPATDARIDADMVAIRGADFHGLPTVWIGDRVLEGFSAERGAAPYEAALDAVASGSHATIAWRPWALVLAASLLLGGFGYLRRHRSS